MNKTEKLRKLKQKMVEDKSLPLQDNATNLVFGEGSPDAELFFLGEGPGYWEDMKARPFVGRAGALLNQFLQLIEVPREDVFITNVVCFRPPSNRDPEPEEIAAFQKYIDKMIEIIDPKVVVTLGRFSMGKFMPGERISGIHGKPRTRDWKGKSLAIIPMYHPAAALRNGDIMRASREDFLMIPEILKEVKENEKQEKEDSAEQIQLI